MLHARILDSGDLWALRGSIPGLWTVGAGPVGLLPLAAPWGSHDGPGLQTERPGQFNLRKSYQDWGGEDSDDNKTTRS